jgi:hypothetical protein
LANEGFHLVAKGLLLAVTTVPECLGHVVGARLRKVVQAHQQLDVRPHAREGIAFFGVRVGHGDLREKKCGR